VAADGRRIASIAKQVSSCRHHTICASGLLTPPSWIRSEKITLDRPIARLAVTIGPERIHITKRFQLYTSSQFILGGAQFSPSRTKLRTPEWISIAVQADAAKVAVLKAFATAGYLVG
jgi:hypothetical protein